MSDLLQNQFRRAPRLGLQGRILLALALAVLVAVGFALDVPFARWLARRGRPSWETLVQFVTQAGDWPILAGASVVGILVARVFRRRRVMTVLCLMLFATVVAGAVVNPIRMLTGRARPRAGQEGGWYGVRKDGKWIVGKHRYSSFPSAHSAVAAAFVTPLLVIGGMRWLPIWLVPLAVGMSRILLGVHHPSDVMVGLILGGASGWLVGSASGLHWEVWRFSSVVCGYGGRWPRWRRNAGIFLGGSSAASV